MNTFTEGNLQISFPDYATVRKFDDEKLHGLSHCMKAVDFVVEESERVLFIELKDPEHPNSKEEDKKKFVRKFLSEALDDDLKYKYRDSFLYEWACGNVEGKKPIFYFVLIAIEGLTEPQISARTESIKQKLPLVGPAGVWSQEIASGCAIFNIETWNRNMPDIPIERVAE